MKHLISIFFLVFLFFGCDNEYKSNSKKEVDLSNVKVKCRHEAMFLSVLFEDYGYETDVVIGRAGSHAITRFLYEDGNWYWLGVKVKIEPVVINPINWEYEESMVYSKKSFLTQMEVLSRLNNFYQGETK